MKIAVIIDTWFPAVGGGQINAWEISKRIAKKGYKIDIITRNNGAYYKEKVKNLNVYRLGQNSEADDNVSRALFLFKSLFLIKKNNYDIVHLQAFLPGLLSPFLRNLLKKPTIFTVHGTRMFEQNPKKSLGFLIEKIILTKIKYDVQISVTYAFLKFKNVNKQSFSTNKQSFSTNKNLSSAQNLDSRSARIKQSFSSNRNIIYIPNGVDLEKFQRVKIKKANYPKILWVGRFDPVKRLEDLLYAMQILKKEIPKAKLTIVGYGRLEKKLKNLKKALKLTNVEFAGKKEDINLIQEYKSSHLFVICSDSEGQPLAVLQALAASLPVVATKTGGIPEIVKDKVNGLLVPPNDYRSLANAIIWCLVNKNNFGKIGHTMVGKMNNWDDIAEKTLSVYRRLSK